jgi:hypothetical protein
MTTPINCILVLGIAIAGALIGGAISYETCEPSGYLSLFECEERAFKGGALGLMVGLFFAAVTWIWVRD